jgi:ketosteroid isomerase-like protein
MKRHFWPLLAVAMIACTSCEQKVDPEKERAAIMAVIHEEADAMAAKDMDRVSALHTQDSLETRLELGVYGFNAFVGWDQIQPLLGGFTAGQQVGNPVNRKENVILKVTGNSAWLTCDNIWEWTVAGEPGGYHNVQITFLEKVDGDWKISFAAYYTKAVPVAGDIQMIE